MQFWCPTKCRLFQIRSEHRRTDCLCGICVQTLWNEINIPYKLALPARVRCESFSTSMQLRQWTKQSTFCFWRDWATHQGLPTPRKFYKSSDLVGWILIIMQRHQYVVSICRLLNTLNTLIKYCATSSRLDAQHLQERLLQIPYSATLPVVSVAESSYHS